MITSPDAISLSDIQSRPYNLRIDIYLSRFVLAGCPVKNFCHFSYCCEATGLCSRLISVACVTSLGSLRQ